MRGQLCTRPATPGQQAKQTNRHRPQVTPEIDHNCKQGAYMNRNIDQQALIRPPRIFDVNTRCPEELIGRNSVKP